jgi:hypothetical protein
MFLLGTIGEKRRRDKDNSKKRRPILLVDVVPEDASPLICEDRGFALAML